MNYQDIFTTEEWDNLKNVMSSIHHNIGQQHMELVWKSYQRISKDTSNQPCGHCGKAIKYWIHAVNTINNYIKENNV